MHISIKRDEAVALYRKATKAYSYKAGTTKVVVFQSEDKGTQLFIQVNTFPTGRVECFGEPLSNKVDDIFEQIEMDSDCLLVTKLKG